MPDSPQSSLTKTYADGEPILPSALDSGDIVLFNRRCTSMSLAGAALCLAAKIFSNSQWDHVGIIIRHPATGELLFLEADFGGVKLRSLEERVRRSKSNEIAVRRLSSLRTNSMREKFYAFSQEMLGRPYDIGTGSVLARVADPLAKQEKERLNALLLDKKAQVNEITRELETAALTTFQRRLLQNERDRVAESCQQIHQRLMKELDSSSALEKFNSDSITSVFQPNTSSSDSPQLSSDSPVKPKSTDLSHVFCSQLVAAAYQRVGLLGTYPPTYHYNPKDFSSQQTHPPGVHLLKSARLSNEEYIRRSTRSSSRSSVSAPKKASLEGISNGDTPSRDSRKFIRDVLKRSPIFNMVPDEYKRSHLLKSFRAQIFEPGDLIFEQGQYGDEFYIMDTGLVERFIQKGEGDPTLVNTIGSGSSFGFSAFTYSSPRFSTIRAKERTILWVLDRQTFELFRDASSDISSIMDAIDNRQLRHYMQNHFLFKRLDKIGHEQVSPFFKVKFRAGETVFKQGDLADNFYIIKNGEFERHIRHPKRPRFGGDGPFNDSRTENDEDTLVKTLEPGQSFGELSLMYNAPRGATVRARTDAECWALSTESFNKLNLTGGTQHLRAVFNKNASVKRDGQVYMTRKDLMRFAGVDAFPEDERERLAALLVSLVTSNRQREPENKRIQSKTRPDVGSIIDKDMASISNDGDEDEVDDVLMDFWEFVRFDIVLNQPSADMAFAFRLADQNNSGFISLDEMENLLQSYASIDESARRMLTGKNSQLRKVFGRDGSRLLPVREFHELSHNILPPKFVEDVKTLTTHMLNMDFEAADLHRTQDEEELAFIEPEGGLSFIGSTFMNPSARNGILSQKAESHAYYGRTQQSQRTLPKWMIALDLGHLISVGVTGAASRTAVAPLERLKILMQTNGLRNHPSGWFSSFRAMVNQDHSIFRSFYRGNGANVIRIVPSAAIQFVMVDQLREMQLMRTLMDRDSWLSSSLSSFTPSSQSEPLVSGAVRTRAVEAVLIGGIAGMVAATATYPFDFIRGRLAVQRKGFEPYRGTIHGISEAMRNEGFFSLYRGLGPTLAGVFSYVGLSFGIYETLRPILPKRNDQSGIPTTSSTMFCGMFTSATGQLASFPLDTCRHRMQVAGFASSSSSDCAKSFAETWREIHVEMGWRGFFRGVVPNLLKIAPASAVSFIVYENVRAVMGSGDDRGTSDNRV